MPITSATELPIRLSVNALESSFCAPESSLAHAFKKVSVSSNTNVSTIACVSILAENETALFRAAKLARDLSLVSVDVDLNAVDSAFTVPASEDTRAPVELPRPLATATSRAKNANSPIIAPACAATGAISAV